MQIKKRYFVIVLVLLLGLTSFTFASPRQVEKQKSAKGVSERVANDKKENRSYAEALEAVEVAEENPTLDTVETARNEIRNANDATAEQITQLQNRVDVVEETIDVAALVTEVETLAEVKETRAAAKEKYPNAETEVNKLADGEVKNNLTARLEKVLRLLNDTEAPKITGVTNGSYVNKSETIYVSDEFLFNVKITGPNSKGVVETKEFNTENFIASENNESYTLKYKANYEGKWTVVATDKLGNTTTETFTIDKTAAKKNAVNANVIGYKNEVSLQYATNGNTISAYISLNEELKYNPTFTFYANGKEIKVVEKTDVVASISTNANYPYVYTAKLKIDENLEAKDGALTFVVTDIVDKAGNETADITKVSNSKVIKLDRTPNRVTFTSIKTSNNVVEGNTYYVKNGDTITLRIGFREKLGTNAVVKIGGREAKLKYVNYFEQPNHHEYTATLTIPENESELTEGKLSFTIENVTDEVGNKGFYYQTNGKTVLETITKNVTTNGEEVVYDRTAAERVYSTVRVNKTEYNENGIRYYYIKNGDSFEFAISFNERLSEPPVVTIAGRKVEMKLNEKVLENENKVVYEGTFKIDANEKELKQGTLEIKVSNVKDIVGNESTSKTVTDQTVTSNFRTVVYDCKNPVVSGVNNNYYYNAPITITAVDYIVHNVSPIAEATIDGETYELGTEYAKEGTHKFIAYDRAGNKLGVNFTIDLTAPALTIKPGSEGVDPYYNKISFKLSDNISVDYYVLNGKKIDVTNNNYSDANYDNIKNKLVAGENTLVVYDVAGNSYEKTFKIAKNTLVFKENVGTITEDVHLVNESFYNNIKAEEPIIINGNGKTVTQYVTSPDKLAWKANNLYEQTNPASKNIPVLGNVFSSLKGAKVTVNDITFAGTHHSIMLGNYEDSSSNWFNTEFNNVNIIDTSVVSLSANIAPAAVIYGTATLNNVNIYGTKRSELEVTTDDRWPFWPVYDLGAVNSSNTTINGGKIGTMYLWAKAVMKINDAEVDTIDTYTTSGHLEIGSGTTVNRINMLGTNKYKPDVTIKAGATVKVLDLSKVTNFTDIIIEAGANVETVVTADGEMSYDEWAAQTNYTTVNSVEEFKTALTEGYKKIIIATTLDIEESQTFTAASKTFVTTKGTITMFNVKEGQSLTLENLVLDGENKYKVDVTKAAETHNDPYNLSGKYPLEQTRIYENTPLIKTAGTLTLGKGTVIRNYAHQPLNGTAKQQYGGPAILVTGGTTVINGLEFTNNVSQLLTAQNATITINDINVHDTWANGNKAGLIEINADAIMNVNNGTFKNNMMSMRSYGLFIANAGTINMKNGYYENNYSTKNGSNTAGSLFGVETTGKIYMTGGTIQNNIGYRAGAFATRWATDGSIIELNAGTIKNNTTRDSAFKNAAIFVQSHVKIGKNMILEDKVVLRGSTALLDNEGKIVGDVEFADNLGTFNNNGTVTGTIIEPQA